MSTLQLESLGMAADMPQLAPEQPEHLQPLADYLTGKIRAKMDAMEAEGKVVEVMDPDWCRANPEEAGKLHAEVIIGTYGSTYALPNKDPEANRAAIEQGDLDVYLMRVNGEVTGTTCLVNTHDGRAELGRSAAAPRSGNTIIQDLRILDWLTNSETAEKYHTLFTTLRSAPDRVIEGEGEDFIMRGGQAITEHWRKFPGLVVNGVAPLYLKHGALEQFTVASITRNQINPNHELFIGTGQGYDLVSNWHGQYGLPAPTVVDASREAAAPAAFAAHYPPQESGLTHLVHADIVPVDNADGRTLDDCIFETEDAGSPFSQVVVPLDRDTICLQAGLEDYGFQVFGYQPATDATAPALLYGRVRPGTSVVPTHWNHEGIPNPFWQHPELAAMADEISGSWR